MRTTVSIAVAAILSMMSVFIAPWLPTTQAQTAEQNYTYATSPVFTLSPEQKEQFAETFDVVSQGFATTKIETRL